jgi:hypothetical protein
MANRGREVDSKNMKINEKKKIYKRKKKDGSFEQDCRNQQQFRSLADG